MGLPTAATDMRVMEGVATTPLRRRAPARRFVPPAAPLHPFFVPFSDPQTVVLKPRFFLA
jgi:hypothetical protein